MRVRLYTPYSGAVTCSLITSVSCLHNVAQQQSVISKAQSFGRLDASSLYGTSTAHDIIYIKQAVRIVVSSFARTKLCCVPLSTQVLLTQRCSERYGGHIFMLTRGEID